MKNIIAGIKDITMISRHCRSSNEEKHGQSLVEFALLLPLFVLIIVGIFDLGRAFFAFIAISNAAREGTRVYTFSPKKTQIDDINASVRNEIGGNSVVDPDNIAAIGIQCGNPLSPITTDAQLAACPSENPMRVTVSYTQTMILGFFFPEPLILQRSAEMMVP